MIKTKHHHLGKFTGIFIFILGFIFYFVSRKMFSVCLENNLINCIPAQLFLSFGRIFMVFGVVIFVFSMLIHFILRPAKKRYNDLYSASTNNYIHCHRCNAPIKENSRFCMYCGSSQDRN